MVNSITPLYNGIIGSKENQDLFRILGNFCLTNADNPFVYDYVGTTFRIISGTFVWNGILYKITNPIFNNNITNGYIFLYEYAGQIEIESSVGIENDPNYVYIGRINNGVFTQSIRNVNHSLENLELLLNRMTAVESVNITQNIRLNNIETKNKTQDNRLAAIEGYSVLWSGGVYMNDTQQASLSECISEQSTGIIVVWSKYASGPLNADWHYFFIPKFHALIHDENGIGMVLRNVGGNGVATKYLYIGDHALIGAATNTTAPNNNFVLRYVLGV